MPPSLPSVPPHASEATRLLCAGTYLDAGYRDRVIEELHLNEQRFVAPSLGLDTARVLAHALRARRLELQWAGATLGVWVAGAILTGGLLAEFAWAGVYLAIAAWARGREKQPPLYRRVLAFFLRWAGRFLFVFGLLGMAGAAFGGADDGLSPYNSSGGLYDAGSSGLLSDLLTAASIGVEPWQGWATLVLLVLIALCEAARRGWFAKALVEELSRHRFPDAGGDPAERDQGQRFRRLSDRIRVEQHGQLIMYHEARPFCGAGEAYETWALAVELKPDALRKQQPLSNRAVLEKIRPRLEQLRLPAEHAGTSARDRLRALEIDECVFLPAEGLLERAEAPYHPQAVEEHLTRAVEEGGEKRRHFLRIRVGGWDEELVVTVFVRVHTQGRMLVLEIAPHVLLPVREDFKEADRTAHRFHHNSRLGKAAAAVPQVPRSAASSLATLGKGVAYAWRLLTGGYAHALPDGPALSVRELGSAPAGSQFQDMDVSRYLKSIQDRVAHGVRAALAESGYQTGEFVQQVNNISNGGVHIGRVEGSTFAVGEHASASATTGGPAPQKGSGSDVHG